MSCSTATQHHHDSSLQTMTVNVKLCGSMSRKDMVGRYFPGGALCSQLRALTSQERVPLRLSPSCLAATNGSNGELPTHHTTVMDACDGIHGILRQIDTMRSVDSNHAQENQQLAPHFEPPTWAVPARGESRLEPVCEALGRQSAVDLTSRSFYRIGRSPNCDVQLMHGTSSRRHAMLFHHSNGSCYIVDCGSAHGTFVNGVRIASPSNGGVVVPHKVRRGALIRLGGPGAPCFILKSFSFQLDDIETAASDTSDMGELVRRNTRLNALGKTASESLRETVSATIFQALNVSRKRSFDSLSTRDTFDDDDSCKRMRCSSPPLSPEAPLRLVSPDLPSIMASKPRRVTFSPDAPQLFYPASVTPDELSCEEDNES